MSETSQETLTTQLVAISKELGCQFTVKGEAIAAEQVFSKQGLLPALLRRADQLCSFCLGYGLGITFERAEGSMLGVTVELDQKTPVSLRLLCITDVLIEIIQSGPGVAQTPLDELMMD